jgi:hypothetical protein
MSCFIADNSLKVMPNDKNEVALVLSISLVNFAHGTDAIMRNYENETTQFGIIFENTPDGISKANAHLFEYLLKLIEPDDMLEALEGEGWLSLAKRTSPFKDKSEYKQYLQLLNFGYGDFGSDGKAFGHALTSEPDLARDLMADHDYRSQFLCACEPCGFSFEHRDIPLVKQLNPLMIEAFRNKDLAQGFLTPLYIIDCAVLGEPMIQPEWVTESFELYYYGLHNDVVSTPKFELIRSDLIRSVN